jgi:hypothetical protein
MGKASRDKGKRGERMLAALLREEGYDCRRTSQYCGQTGDAADVVGLPGCHIEVKFVERLNVCEALEQAKRDAPDHLYPLLFHKRSRSPWKVTMEFDTFIQFYREWHSGRVLEEVDNG